MSFQSQDSDYESINQNPGNMNTNKYIRHALKMIREEEKTAYDSLPSGETFGAFSNRYVLNKYIRKKINKREQARNTRRKKKKRNEIIFPDQ
jgi:hypothetical protein